MEEEGVPEREVDRPLTPPQRELDPDSPARRAVLPPPPPPEIRERLSRAMAMTLGAEFVV